jgi:hypothetical protein
MSAPLLFPPSDADKAEQLTLPGAKEMFEAVGLADLPQGAAVLSRKQLEFCVAYLKTGSAVAAGKTAGYADPEAHASKIMKVPGVAAFLAKAVARVAGNADQLIKRVWQRSADLQAEIEELRAKPLRDWKRERELMTLANQTDTLLGTLLGKLVLKIEGDVNHHHTITPEQRAQIIQLQQEFNGGERRAG